MALEHRISDRLVWHCLGLVLLFSFSVSGRPDTPRLYWSELLVWGRGGSWGVAGGVNGCVEWCAGPVWVFFFFKSAIELIQIKSNHFYCAVVMWQYHSTSALVSEILESVLQTVQKQFTYRQYLYLQTVQKTMCKIHIHILSTHSVL